MLVAHGVAADFKGEDFAVANDIAQRDAFRGFDGFDGLAGGDAAEERQAIGASFSGADREYVDGTAAIVGALEETLVLKVGDVFMHSGERAEAQAAGDLLVGGGVAVLLGEVGKEVDDFFLPPCDSHAEIVANKKRIASVYVSP